MKQRLLLIAIASFCVLASCKQEIGQENATGSELFKSLPSSYTGIDFKNTITETEENNHLVWESIYNGAGVGVGDINGDGLLDIYMCGNMTDDKLYLNKGKMQFEDITIKANIKENTWSSGVTMADVNNDGLLDIYVCKMSWHKDKEKADLRKNKLYINKGNNYFEEKAEEYGVADAGHSTQASFFDYNKDGLLDLYVMNAPSHRYDQKLEYMSTNSIPYEFNDHLYLNKGGDKFEDVTKTVIGGQESGFGLGLATVDLNQDGWTDIYVANDFEKPDYMLINDRNGGFVDELKQRLRHTSYSSMGMDVADINNDTLYDIAVLDMQSNDHVRSKTNMPSMNIAKFWENVGRGYHFQFMSNMLQLNNGIGYYSEIGQLSGMASTDWSWSILLADMDNDSYRDAVITNGINRNIKDNDFNNMMRNAKRDKDFSFLKMAMKTKVEKVENFAFRNVEGKLTFEDVSKAWGFSHNGFSFGSAYGDLDNDGDLDVVVSNNNELAMVYENQNKEKHHAIRFAMKKGKSDALNGKIKIFYQGGMQIAEVHNVRGYQSCSEPIAHFGLGIISEVDSVIAVFQDGKTTILRNVLVDSTYTLHHEDARGIQKANSMWNPLIKEITDATGLRFLHKENPYDDFENQILIPHMESHNGPFCTVGDVNNDGKEDMFIGGAKGQAGAIFIQSASGTFSPGDNDSFVKDQACEDMGCVFVDIDKDKDLDLYVVSGGSEDTENSDLLQHRLYLNDGKGKFTRDAYSLLPKSNGSVVVPIDVNNDGFMDLFVGGRMESKRYPFPGLSHLLINDKGRLKPAPEFTLKKLGMVTSALAMDVNLDGWKDLVVVGEWMQPTFLINDKGHLTDQTAQWLPEKNVGWWFDIKNADVDGDGVDEILLGNIGMNNKYKASNKKPLKVYGADFDRNNSYDIILSKQTKYGEVPVRGFECSSQQLPRLKKKFDSYNDFAHAKIPDIIDIEKSKPLLLEANNFRSGYLKLTGNKYTFIDFPTPAEISSIQGMEVADVNKDGMNDIILVGNLYDAEVETVRHDASVGLILLASKQGLSAMRPLESGFYAAGNARDVKSIQIKNSRCLLVTNNSYKAQIFQILQKQ